MLMLVVLQSDEKKQLNNCTYKSEYNHGIVRKYSASSNRRRPETQRYDHYAYHRKHTQPYQEMYSSPASGHIHGWLCVALWMR